MKILEEVIEKNAESKNTETPKTNFRMVSDVILGGFLKKLSFWISKQTTP